MFVISDINKIIKAAEYEIYRKGTFSSLDPLSLLKDKLRDNKNDISLDKQELNLLISTIESNISYVSQYEYPNLSVKNESKTRNEALLPLKDIHKKLNICLKELAEI